MEKLGHSVLCTYNLGMLLGGTEEGKSAAKQDCCATLCFESWQLEEPSPNISCLGSCISESLPEIPQSHFISVDKRADVERPLRSVAVRCRSHLQKRKNLQFLAKQDSMKTGGILI